MNALPHNFQHEDATDPQHGEDVRKDVFICVLETFSQDSFLESVSFGGQIEEKEYCIKGVDHILDVIDNIGFHAICREAVDVSSVTIDDWKQRIASIIDGYKLNDIYNCDETGLFYCALPDKTLAIKGQEGLRSMSTKGIQRETFAVRQPEVLFKARFHRRKRDRIPRIIPEQTNAITEKGISLDALEEDVLGTPKEKQPKGTATKNT
ncbi:hypothetical protein LSAT2_023084 [Lamellibrachia satsuma]|nr:hypothetical protein LSAT2_023084 [Lamellibrachia satsuma]